MQSIPSYKRRLLMILFGCLQNICAGGLIYGWAGLSNILITPTTEGGFGLSPPVTLQIFSVSSSFACLSQLFLGIIQDKYNPKVCSIISNIIVALGCFVFVASVRSRFLIYSGAILIGVGGPGVQLSLLHLGNLFPGRENTVMSLINGTINLSFIVFPLLTSIWVDGNVSFQSLFQFLGGSILILVLISFWVWQDTTYEKNPGISCAEIKNNSDDEISLSEIQPERDGIDSNMTATSTLEDLSFREQMHSGRVIRLAIFFVVTSFWANYYIASISTELNDKGQFDEATRNNLIQAFSYMSAAGVIFSPIAGYLLDVIGSFWTNIITNLFGLLQMLLLLVPPSETHMMESFVIYGFFRSFLYPCFFSDLATSIGFQHFGVISGLVVAISGFIFLVLVPLLSNFAIGTCHDSIRVQDGCSRGNWNEVHFMQIFSLILLILMEVMHREMNRSSPSTGLKTKQADDRKDGQENYGSVQGAELVTVEHSIV